MCWWSGRLPLDAAFITLIERMAKENTESGRPENLG
jgi:hypothetical protein